MTPLITERLEPRTHLSAVLTDGGTLFVWGTHGGDEIRVGRGDLTSRPGFPDRPVYVVRVNDEVSAFDAEAVERIVVRARGGDDDIRVAHSSRGIDLVWGDDEDPVRIPVTLRGGGGDDLLVGGDDDDLLTGDGGDDTLSGNGGDDALLGGAGNDRLAGGVGIDKNVGGAGADRIVDSKRKIRLDGDDDFWFVGWGFDGLDVRFFF